jgi:hypothetical protein
MWMKCERFNREQLRFILFVYHQPTRRVFASTAIMPRDLGLHYRDDTKRIAHLLRRNERVPYDVVRHVGVRGATVAQDAHDLGGLARFVRKPDNLGDYAALTGRAYADEQLLRTFMRQAPHMRGWTSPAQKKATLAEVRENIARDQALVRNDRRVIASAAAHMGPGTLMPSQKANRGQLNQLHARLDRGDSLDAARRAVALIRERRAPWGPITPKLAAETGHRFATDTIKEDHERWLYAKRLHRRRDEEMRRYNPMPLSARAQAMKRARSEEETRPRMYRRDSGLEETLLV